MGSIHVWVLNALELFLFLFVVLFTLTPNQAFAYPEPKFQSAIVFSLHAADGSTKTIFVSTISGPSPEDETSFSATGPSGTFHLSAGRSYRQYGLQYKCVENSIISNGSYTFEVTDSLGRSATVVRDFTYDGTVPKVDSATMSPANWSYVGTTTPTLSFDPVAGAAYYQVVVCDYDGKAIWYLSPVTTDTSFAVPSGLLQPDTAYYWETRVWDGETNPQKLS